MSRSVVPRIVPNLVPRVTASVAPSVARRTPSPRASESAREQFRADVLRGLRQPVKEIPCKYFYDEVGSALFEAITRTPEYYPTRIERAIMERDAEEMAERLGPGCLLVEYGSGSSAKTRLLLDRLRRPAGYVPIDVSDDFLRQTARQLAVDYPEIEIRPLSADFTGRLSVPDGDLSPARRVVYFPGSTIGNFTPQRAISLLRRTARLCRRSGGLLIGVDLQKDPAVLDAAYNDAQGVTAAFNRNLLARINRELGGTFRIECFTHRACYDREAGRIEMQLVSERRQRVVVAGRKFSFAAGEPIRTEYSHKYTLEGFGQLAAAAGFRTEKIWRDEQDFFSVHELSVHPS